MVENINNQNVQINTTSAGTKTVSEGFNVQNINKSIFNIDENSLDKETKELWDKTFSDSDGDGHVSEGDFTTEELALTNGNKTFKDFLSGVMGKPWKLAQNIITNIKVMFIKSMPGTKTAYQSDENAIKDIIKSRKLKPGAYFEYDNNKYVVSPEGYAIADMKNTGKETLIYSDDTKVEIQNLSDNSDIKIYNPDGTTIRRSDYDDGSAVVRISDSEEEKLGDETYIRIRGPRGENGIPQVFIRENK